MQDIVFQSKTQVYICICLDVHEYIGLSIRRPMLIWWLSNHDVQLADVEMVYTVTIALETVLEYVLTFHIDCQSYPPRIESYT